MSKSVYSIVLSDEVVRAVDVMAARLGTNRSNLINQILAERVSVMTPEKRMRDIFESIFALMDDSFIKDAAAPGSALSMRSSIAYKYKPTVRYSVELTKTPEGDRIGNLRISFRTRSQAFMEMLGIFYRLWIMNERQYTQRRIEYKAESDRLTRGIYFPAGRKTADTQLIGGLISEYIKAFDKALKAFFAYADDIELASAKVSECYRLGLKNGISDI